MNEAEADLNTHKDRLVANLSTLKKFEGLEGDLHGLHLNLRTQFSEYREAIETSPLSESIKKNHFISHDNLIKELHGLLLEAKGLARKRATQLTRDELFKMSQERHRQLKPQSPEDKIGEEVTNSLKRMLETMRAEVDKSVTNIATAKATTTKLEGTTENYKTLSGTLDESRSLIRELWKRDRSDMIYILGAIGIFVATVVFIVIKRMPSVVWIPGQIILSQLGKFIVRKRAEHAAVSVVDRPVDKVIETPDEAPFMNIDTIIKEPEMGERDSVFESFPDRIHEAGDTILNSKKEKGHEGSFTVLKAVGEEEEELKLKHHSENAHIFKEEDVVVAKLVDAEGFSTKSHGESIKNTENSLMNEESTEFKSAESTPNPDSSSLIHDEIIENVGLSEQAQVQGPVRIQDQDPTSSIAEFETIQTVPSAGESEAASSTPASVTQETPFSRNETENISEHISEPSVHLKQYLNAESTVDSDTITITTVGSESTISTTEASTLAIPDVSVEFGSTATIFEAISFHKPVPIPTDTESSSLAIEDKVSTTTDHIAESQTQTQTQTLRSDPLSGPESTESEHIIASSTRIEPTGIITDSGTEADQEGSTSSNWSFSSDADKYNEL